MNLPVFVASKVISVCITNKNGVQRMVKEDKLCDNG